MLTQLAPPLLTRHYPSGSERHQHARQPKLTEVQAEKTLVHARGRRTYKNLVIRPEVASWQQIVNSCAGIERHERGGSRLRRVGLFPRRVHLHQYIDERSAGAGERPVAAVGEPEFAKKFHIFQIDQLDPSRRHFVASE